MRYDFHAARVWFLRDVEWAKQLSFGCSEYQERSDANADRDPDSLSPLEIQFQISTRIGRRRRSPEPYDSGPESWALMQAREFGALLVCLKKRLGPRDFEGWMRAFCLFSPRTGARYMRIAREWGYRPVETSRVEFDCSWRGHWVRDRVTLESAERSFAEPPGAPEHPGEDA